MGTIIDKVTGRIDYQDPESNDLRSISDPSSGRKHTAIEYIALKMMKNEVLLAQKCGNIVIFSKDFLSNKWIRRDLKTKFQTLDFMFGDEKHDVIGYGFKRMH